MSVVVETYPDIPALVAAAGHRLTEGDRVIRRGDWTGPTSGLAPGYVQGNLAILPKAFAADFARFCQLNPKPCPLLPPTTTNATRSRPARP